MRRPTLWTLAAALSLGLAVLAATPTNLPQALEAQRRLVADNPSDAAAYNDLGNLLLLAGEVEEARAAYERAVELAPDRAAYHYNLALLLQQEERPREALDHLRAVADLDPTNAWAAYQIGALHERMDHREQAIEWYGRAFRLDPDLAFPDVNPAVIDSELTAEAMLRGYKAGPIDPAAPRIYEEPGRISALLVSPPAATAVAEGGAA
ncbi:MAG TPA: tetratricopeptide repeat protein, partial [Thermoanaerobaculia bacterium]|nr:tetratricopeptide repeat protein [Thermoanaerobaculia bacterium]